KIFILRLIGVEALQSTTSLGKFILSEAEWAQDDSIFKINLLNLQNLREKTF
ncbi:hypothetical protein PMI10_03604, partial [Flavobacterium sp. CF136]